MSAPSARPVRESHRVPADLDCLVRMGDRELVGRTRDVAMEGLGIELSEPPQPGMIGARITVRLELPAVGAVALAGEAVRAELNDRGGCLLGVRITRAGRLRRPVRASEEEPAEVPRRKPRRSREIG